MLRATRSIFPSIRSCVCLSLKRLLYRSTSRMVMLVTRLFHTSYRSLLGSINWLQSRTQFQACYQFSRLASASAAPTVAHCKELNKLCRQIRGETVELRVWPVKGSPRILGIPDAAFRNNSDKSSQRAMTIFIADERVREALWSSSNPLKSNERPLALLSLNCTL